MSQISNFFIASSLLVKQATRAKDFCDFKQRLLTKGLKDLKDDYQSKSQLKNNEYFCVRYSFKSFVSFLVKFKRLIFFLPS